MKPHEMSAEELGLRPEELELPPRVDDPHGMAFTDEQMDALCDVDNEETRQLVRELSTPEKRALLDAEEAE